MVVNFKFAKQKVCGLDTRRMWQSRQNFQRSKIFQMLLEDINTSFFIDKKIKHQFLDIYLLNMVEVCSRTTRSGAQAMFVKQRKI